ncbi:hypothetical protein SAMN04487934_10896 [Eubacterium ruminantium]|nr:hypothetical protein SAMN04487934_10896 [Eubacterium ruminantium]
MRIRKIALGLATAFVLAAPVSGVAFDNISVVEAATVDMLSTRVTPTAGVDVAVTFFLTDQAKAQFAIDLDAILSLTLTGQKQVVINDVQKTAYVSEGDVYLDETKLVDYIAQTTGNVFEIEWPSGLSAESVKLFGDFGALARDYACVISVEGIGFSDFKAENGVYSVKVNQTDTINYTIDGNSIVFDDDCSDLFENLADVATIKVESVFKNADGIQKATDGKWYLAKDGVRNSAFTGFAQYDKNGRWFYVQKGVLPMDEEGNFSTKGIYKGTVDGVTADWFVSSGRVQTEFTGLYHASNGWKMIVDGKVSTTYSGIAYAAEKKSYYYVQNGKINFSVNGQDTINGKYGTVDGKTAYWYTSKGRVVTDMTRLIKFSNGVWRAVVNGQVMLKSDKWTGIIEKASGKKYYVKDSVLQSKFTGKVTIKGVTYNIVRGVVVE